MTDVRLKNLQNWLGQVIDNSTTKSLVALPGDAGFRRYFRIASAITLIAVDAPPETENNQRFIDIANHLNMIGIRVPTIKHCCIEQGFFVLEDLGNQLLFDYLSNENVDQHYQAAIDTLLKMQFSETVFTASSPLLPFDHAMMQNEMQLCQQWFFDSYLQLSLTAQQQQVCTDFFETLIATACQQPQHFMHRDFHCKNLFIMPDAGIATIDFQDAMLGPVTYDLVSLIKDAYVDWPDEHVKRWAQFYFTHYQAKDNHYKTFADFWRDVEWMGCQRHLKCLYIFTRKFLRDDNPNYLQYLPRVIDYIRSFCSQYHDVYDFGLLLETVIVPRFKERSCSP